MQLDPVFLEEVEDPGADPWKQVLIGMVRRQAERARFVLV
jgi:hypothetical protein